MKKLCFLAAFCLLFSWTQVAAQNSAARAEISFSFERLSGFSSNQFAVWIEDGKGDLVKTLFATKFTASGGWKKRASSIPLWVNKSGLAGLDKKDIDAFTGATPRAGELSYRWDGTDKKGVRMPPGDYRVVLEATLREDDRVIYSAFFTLGSGTGGAVEAEVRTHYFGSKTYERRMTGNVRILYRP